MLDLLPADNVSLPIQVTVQNVSLLDPPKYKALSYVWGDASRTSPITVNGQVFQATTNLRDALQYIRRHDETVTLWVDAICINQHDNAEKVHQIAMMGNIYASSDDCVVWMGDYLKVSLNTVQVKSAFQMIKKIASLHDQIIHHSYCVNEADFDSSSVPVLIQLMRNAWWTRIWTIQEVVFPTQKKILWGDQMIPWETLTRASAVNQHWHNHPDSYSFLPSFFDSHRFSGTVSAIDGMQTSGLALEIFWRFRCREATDSRDKIFALLSFLNSAEKQRFSLEDGYQLNAAQLYQKVSLGLLKSMGNLKPLIGLRGERQKTENLPSWVVDWVGPERGYDRISRFWDHYFRYGWFSCDGGTPLFLQEDELHFTISLRGYLVDTVAMRAEPAAPPQEDFQSDIPLDKIVETVKRWRRLILLDSRSPQTKESLKTSFCHVVSGGLVTRRGMPLRRLNADDQVDFERFCRIEHDKDCSCEIFDTIRSTIYAQTLFVTQMGYLGMGPSSMMVGDEVWILHGSNVPFVLRPFQSMGHYICIGDVYLHGIMSGEFVKEGSSVIQTVVLH